MIGGLQGEFGDLDIKYLKQNISKCRSKISGSFRRNSVALYTERKTLRVSAIRGSGHVWPGKLKRPPLPFGCEISGCEISDQRIRTCLTGEVETSFSPIRMWDIWRKWKVGRIEFLPGWNELCRASLSGATPSGFPKKTRGALPYPNSLREKYTTLVNITPRTIAYPI